MNKAAMWNLKEQFHKQIGAMKYIDLYHSNNEPKESSYWNPGGNDFSDVVDAEREHLLNK